MVCPCSKTGSSVKHEASCPLALHIPPGARAAVDQRVIRGEASAEEILHHLFTADADPTIVGLVHTLDQAIETLSELIDNGAGARPVGFMMNLAERLSNVLTSEVAKLDFDARARAGKEDGG